MKAIRIYKPLRGERVAQLAGAIKSYCKKSNTVLQGFNGNDIVSFNSVTSAMAFLNGGSSDEKERPAVFLSFPEGNERLLEEVFELLKSFDQKYYHGNGLMPKLQEIEDTNHECSDNKSDQGRHEVVGSGLNGFTGKELEDIYKRHLEMRLQQTLSERFVSDAVFYHSSYDRRDFIGAMQAKNSIAVLQLFVNSYLRFIEKPGSMIWRINPKALNKDNIDTDPRMWNADIFSLRDGDYAALLFMPIKSDALAARIAGIIFSDKGDGYYYCMLKKDENSNSDVFRNKAEQGIEKIGEVSGTGFELMHSFLDCIVKDFYSGRVQTPERQEVEMQNHKDSDNIKASLNRRNRHKDIEIPSYMYEVDFRGIYNLLLHQTLSERFVSGAVFDSSRLARSNYIEAMQSKDPLAVLTLFINSYRLFIDHPEILGIPPETLNKDNIDTEPGMWNADIFSLRDGDYAALLFMPIKSDVLSARIAGIIFSDKGDGYYYCMLKKDENSNSDVFRNKAEQGIGKIGEVSGTGFELMHSFLDCIKNNYYAENS